MKKIILVACLLAFTSIANAQIKGILDRAKQKAEKKANEKVDKTIDKTTEPAPGNEAGKKTGEDTVPNTDVKQGTDTGKEVKSEPGIIKAYSKYWLFPY